MNRRAIIIVLVAIALLLIATTIKSGWLYLVSSSLFALLIASAIVSRMTISNIELERSCAPEVFEGEPFKVSLRIRSKGHLPRYLLKVSDLQFSKRGKKNAFELIRKSRGLLELFPQDETRNGEEGAMEEFSGSVTVERIEPRGFVDVDYRLVALKRGVFKRANIEISSMGFTGAWHSKRVLDLESPITVFPRIYEVSSFPFEPIATYSPVESYEWPRKGAGQDYFGIREYVRGDSLRHIHWKASAHQGKLVVKEFQQEFRPSAAIVLALGKPRFGRENINSLEDGLRAAASIAAYYCSLGSLPRIINGATETPEACDLRGCLRIFASFEPQETIERKEPLSRLIKSSIEILEQGSAISLITNADAKDFLEVIGETPVTLQGFAFVLINEASYLAKRRDFTEEEIIQRIADEIAMRGAHLYVVRHREDIARCLSEPYITTNS